MNKSSFFLRKEFKFIIIIAIAAIATGIAFINLASAENRAVDPQQFDFNQLGSPDAPTTNWETLQAALEVLGQRSTENKGGWLHFRYENYNPDSDGEHPFYAEDGHSFTDMWYDVSETGTIERTLGIKTDSNGVELQVTACGDGICGNLSILRLAEDYPTPAIGDFTPTVRSSSTKGLIAEVNASGEDATLKGWVEGEGDSQILYISRDLSPKTASGEVNPDTVTHIIVGFSTQSGEPAYYRNAMTGEDGTANVLMEQRLVLFDVLENDLSTEKRYGEVMEELLASK
jgi:hypothetical protein